MDDKRSNQGIGTGFLADMLRDLQKQYEIDKKPKDKGKRGKGTAMPAGQDAKGAAMPGIRMMHVTDEADPRPGDMLLDIYRVESDAIKGGMGAVWRVHHTGWDVDLAMKRPHPEVFRTDEQKQNFTDECRYWMNLGLHPNIVSCYYVREIGGIPTIFSEWMENGSLESHIKDRTLYDGTREEVEERILDIAIQFARGLHYAHENDLIHQDVKPDNLLLARDWSAKVSDFGLAKARTMLTFLDGIATEPDYDSDATMVSPGGGRTPAYCSPEQAAGQLLTRRTDLYSWAVSVLEMYLGYKPWAHGRELTGPLVGTVCRDYFDMCSEWPVPEALQNLLEKCMEMDPDDRPRDFAEVETELLAIYRNVTGRRYTNSAPKGARDTADSLNNKAISHLDLGQEEEAVALLERCVRLRHFDGTLNLALYRWRKNITGVKAFLQTVDGLEGPYWERRGELAQVRKQICLEACGLQEPPSFRLVTPQGFGDASLSSADVRDGKLLAVIRKHWKDGKKYYYVCHFDVDTGALLTQYPGDHEQPGIPCTSYENYTKLFDGGRMMYLNSMRGEEQAVFDVLSQQRIHEQTDYSFNADRFVTRSFFLYQVFTSKGELLPEFQDGVPLIGKKIDGDRVYEITRAATWKPCARVAAKRLIWLRDGQFLIHTKRDSFLLYDVENNTSCLLFSRGRQDGETVLKDPSRKIVISPGQVRYVYIYEYKPGCFVLCVNGRYFTLPDLQELKNGRFAEQTGPEPRVAQLGINPYELSLDEVLSGRSLLTVPVPELPEIKGKMRNYYHILSDRKCGFALVFQPRHQVAWAVIHIDYCPSQTPQMPYRISTPVTTAAALEQESVDQQRLSEFH